MGENFDAVIASPPAPPPEPRVSPPTAASRLALERKGAHGLLLLYLLGSLVFFVRVGLPVLEGRLDFKYFVDSDIYEELAATQETRLADLVLVDFNGLGPHLILHALGFNRVLVYLFNLLVFLGSYRLLRRHHDVDPRRLVLLLAASPVLFSSLMSINKEILALVTVALVAAFYVEHRPWHLIVALALSPLVRWQSTVFVVVAACLEWRPLRGHRGLGLAGLVLGCSIVYPLLLGAGVFTSIDDLVQTASLETVEGSGLFNLWLDYQNRFAYFLVVVPKSLHLFVGLVARFHKITDLTDVYNNVVATSQCFVNLLVLLAAFAMWRRGRISLRDSPAFLAAVFTIVFGLSPIYSPRYLFPVYVLLAVLVAGRGATPAPAVRAHASGTEALVRGGSTPA